MEKDKQFHLWYLLIAIIGILLLQSLFATDQQVKQIPYSEFQDKLQTGQIEEVRISENRIRGTLSQPLPDGTTAFTTVRVEPDIAKDLKEQGVKFSGEIENTFVRDILSWIIPMLIFFGIWLFLLRRIAGQQGMGGGGFLSVGKSKAKIYVETDTKVTFDDVAGVDEAKAELEEIIHFLRHPEEFGRLGAHVPKGVLLVGPPGTGKTLLARAVAGEAGVRFFSTNGSEFVEMFVGVGAARVRDLFEQARKSAPCIIFIDELDALGRARGVYAPGGGHDEKEQTLNQLLAELDGFDPSIGVILLAATNRPEILDPALLRAGRFDRQILVDRPDRSGRVAILNIHMGKLQLADDVDLEKIAALTPGFTGADLANLANEAAVIATRRRGESVNMDDVTSAIERIVAGLEKKSRILSPFERKVVAYHEMGHALVAKAIPGGDKVQKVSIIPRGIGSLGYTIQRPTEDRFLMSKRELENKMATLLGGRAAEKLVFDEVSTGAADDLAKVTNIARSMIAHYGMSEKLGTVTYDSDGPQFLGGAGQQPEQQSMPSWQPRRYSEETAHDIDQEVRQIVDVAFKRATDILKTNRDKLEEGANALLEKETLTEEEIPEPKPVKEKTDAA